MVAVLSSGLMGSLSGSAVANTATTGTFTIPMMRSAGFRPVTAAGVQAAASSGGALMPPVMGAGAYMMQEIVQPPVTYLEIIRAALIPALLYYLSLLLIVHFHARRASSATAGAPAEPASADGGAGSEAEISRAAGIVFGSALASLILFLILGYTAFRAVTISLAVIIVVSSVSRETRLDWRDTLRASRTRHAEWCRSWRPRCLRRHHHRHRHADRRRHPAARNHHPLAEQSLFLALVLIMVSSIILGMGLPSAVCYLLMATLIGPVLGDLGVIPLAAHLFIFYFGMMSMVTPPVALAAYAASSIADTPIMPTAFAAFRFALVGFTLPYMFIYRPELLMLTASGEAGRLAGDAAPGRHRDPRRRLFRRRHSRTTARATRFGPPPRGFRRGSAAAGARAHRESGRCRGAVLRLRRRRACSAWFSPLTVRPRDTVALRSAWTSRRTT